MRRKLARGSRFGLLFAALALALTGCTAKDWERDLRFGWPTGVTKQGEEMRVLWTWSGVAALALGVIVWGLIFWACIRYRKKNDELPRQTKYNMLIEVICFTFPFIVIAGLFYRTVVVEDDVNHLSAHPDVLVQVDGFKWNWQFEYQSYLGSSGAATPATYPGQSDPSNPNLPYYVSTVGSDNEIPILVIPRGETVQVIEHSDDVIHSFWVPDFLFKRDVVPYGGTTPDNRFEFTATSDGSFVGRCAELCGTYHSQMNFEVRVVEPDVFSAYIAALQEIGPADPARQSKALIAANVPGGAYATTTHPFNTSREPGSPTEGNGG